MSKLGHPGRSALGTRAAADPDIGEEVSFGEEAGGMELLRAGVEGASTPSDETPRGSPRDVDEDEGEDEEEDQEEDQDGCYPVETCLFFVADTASSVGHLACGQWDEDESAQGENEAAALSPAQSERRVARPGACMTEEPASQRLVRAPRPMRIACLRDALLQASPADSPLAQLAKAAGRRRDN